MTHSVSSGFQLASSRNRSFWAILASGLLCLLHSFHMFAQPDLSRELPALPEGYWIGIEPVMVHSEGELAGLTTYRIYANCLNPTDFVSSLSGDDGNPLILESTSAPNAWYNNDFANGWNGGGINPALIAFFPDLAYDSYLTIGAEDASVPSSLLPSIQTGIVDISVEFQGPGFGNNISLVNDSIGSAWFCTFPGLEDADTHPAFAGADLKVLIAQLTTAGEVSGQIQLQVFRNGDQGDELRSLLPIVSSPVPGCIDSGAYNFNPLANADDGSCNYTCYFGTRFDDLTGRCELEAWQGAAGDTETLDPCHLDFDASGWMDVSDFFRYLVVNNAEVDIPNSACGAGTYWDAEILACKPAPLTLGEGNGLNNLNPAYFDLDRDGTLDVSDFLSLLNVLGKACLN